VLRLVTLVHGKRYR